jgi:hypothetical protein
MHKHVFSAVVGLNKAEALLPVIKFHCARNHRVRPFVEVSAVLLETERSRGLEHVCRCLEGLNVRLAISEGETATWSGQMSMMLDKRRAWLLQGE